MLITLHLFLRLKSSVPWVSYGEHEHYLEDVAWGKYCLYLSQFISPYCQKHCFKDGTVGKGSLFSEIISKREQEDQYFSPSVSYNHGVSVRKYPFLLYYLPLLFTPILLLLLSGCDLASLQRDDSCACNLMVSLKMPLVYERQLWGCLHEITVKWFCLCKEISLSFCYRDDGKEWGNKKFWKSRSPWVTLFQICMI